MGKRRLRGVACNFGLVSFVLAALGPGRMVELDQPPISCNRGKPDVNATSSAKPPSPILQDGRTSLACFTYRLVSDWAAPQRAAAAVHDRPSSLEKESKDRHASAIRFGCRLRGAN